MPNNMLSHKSFHLFMVGLLTIIALSLLSILFRHYWIMFFVWLILPLVAVWLAGDAMSSKLSLELHEIAKKLLVGAALVLSVINAGNFGSLRHDIGKILFDGYQIERHYDTESNYYDECSGDALINVIGTPPGQCLIEDLSNVAWYGHVIFYLMEWGGIFLVVLIPVFTLQARRKR